jgi:D-glycero-alpha-D-manno-heptose-7-phosphate kinase
MIISQTPFRISFLGGGTDYPEHFEKEGGAVLGTAIDKSVFHTVMHFHSQLFDYSIRISYRKTECVGGVREIEHAAFRACLERCHLTRDVEVDLTAELPSFSGLGSSSAFVVGLLNALYAFQGKFVPPMALAYEAIDIERNVLKECVGCQDQTFAAVGGFNLMEFRSTDDIVVHRVPLSAGRLLEIESHLLFLYTGLRRRASDVAIRQIQRVEQNGPRLRKMRAMTDKGYALLTGGGDLNEFGRLLHETWVEKQQLDEGVSNDTINELYSRAIHAGALGGKLLGAGGGGFLLFWVPPEKRASVREALGALHEIPVRVNAAGSHIIHAS